MENAKKISVIGGDKRQISLAKYLRLHGCEVYTYGFFVRPDSKLYVCDDLGCALSGAAAVILPLPAFNKELELRTDSEKKITIQNICETADKGTLFLGGMLSAAAKEKFSGNAFASLDYYDNEDLQTINAIPTAEGALAIAIGERTRTISGSHAVVIGFGRIGKVLSKYLAALGARVTVCARRETHFELIRMSGYAAAHTHSAGEALKSADIIFNTVPTLVISESELKAIGDKVPIIELASAPYGVDFDAAERLGKKAILAASLPGKMFPETAGETIGIVVLDLLNKRGVL